MQSTNQETFTETLVEAFIEVQSQDKKTREKESAKRKLETRRAIEDYMEAKRMKSDLEDYYFD